MAKSGFKRQSGQAMIEFVIILPVFFVLLFGAMDVYLAIMAKGSLNYVAEETARCVERNPTACPDPEAYARAQGTGLLLNGADLTIKVTTPDANSTTVTATYQRHSITLIIPVIAMQSTATATN